MKKVLLVGAIIFSISAVGLAAPSVSGSTGLINNPSADVLRSGQFSIGYYNLNDGGAGSLNMNIATNLEVGIAGFRMDNSAGNHTLLNAKYALAPESVLTPGIAVGIEDVADERQRTLYAAASKALPFGFRVHAGVGTGRYNGLFGAIEKTINPIMITGKDMFPATTLIAEYDGNHMNYGARMSIVPGVKVDGGWRDSNWYVGVSFTN
ncbi:MAG: protein of unknown function rane lipoprotein [Firmicutes bacterium]|nr:protein of unknown function rane lipoprotein [Bacillota bacterium]